MSYCPYSHTYCKMNNGGEQCFYEWSVVHNLYIVCGRHHIGILLRNDTYCVFLKIPALAWRWKYLVTFGTFETGFEMLNRAMLCFEWVQETFPTDTAWIRFITVFGDMISKVIFWGGQKGHANWPMTGRRQRCLWELLAHLSWGNLYPIVYTGVFLWTPPTIKRSNMTWWYCDRVLSIADYPSHFYILSSYVHACSTFPFIRAHHYISRDNYTCSNRGSIGSGKRKMMRVRKRM